MLLVRSPCCWGGFFSFLLFSTRTWCSDGQCLYLPFVVRAITTLPINAERKEKKTPIWAGSLKLTSFRFLSCFHPLSGWARPFENKDRPKICVLFVDVFIYSLLGRCEEGIVFSKYGTCNSGSSMGHNARHTRRAQEEDPFLSSKIVESASRPSSLAAAKVCVESKVES